MSLLTLNIYIYLFPEARSTVCLGFATNPTSCCGSHELSVGAVLVILATCEVGLLKSHKGYKNTTQLLSSLTKKVCDSEEQAHVSQASPLK